MIRRKISTPVDFPLEGWDITAFAAQNSQPRRLYNLRAVINHHSILATSGHYTTYARHLSSESWYKYDDEKVDKMNRNDVVSEEGYVMFYELQEPGNLTLTNK